MICLYFQNKTLETSMKIPKLTALVFTIFLILFTSYFILHESTWDKTVSLSVTISSQEGYEEKLFCWKDETSVDNYFIFLPSYANLSESVIHADNAPFCTITLNNKEITDKLLLNDFCLDIAYPLLYQYRGETYGYTLTFVQSANISTMYIDTQSGNMDYIHETKGNKESGIATVYTSDGKLDFAGSLDFIKGRGNSTWTAWPKKPYNIKLSQEANLLNMGSAQEWVLLAEYTDISCMKNKIAYEVAQTVGLTYTPDCDWIDLYINGKYAGLYLLCERIDIHPERVNINSDL